MLCFATNRKNNSDRSAFFVEALDQLPAALGFEEGRGRGQLRAFVIKRDKVDTPTTNEPGVPYMYALAHLTSTYEGIHTLQLRTGV